MNFLGFEIKLAGGNNKYVKKDDCHYAMDSINKRLDDHNSAINVRVDDLIGKVDMIVDLLKNGK